MADTKGKRVTFDIETWQALDMLARDRMMTFDELADEAFRDVLTKHGRPSDVHDAFKRSARAADREAGEDTKARKVAESPPAARRKRPKSKRPAGGRRARS
jgi:hypothetical protein